MNIIIDRRFFESAHALGSHADRVFAFLERLLADPAREGANLERIERAADAKLCSLRVSSELRAIGLERGPDLVLLYVGHHEDAYRWARTHRAIHDAEGLHVVQIPEGVVEGLAVPEADAVVCAPAQTCDLSDETARRGADSG
jgi:hypothetical protein